MKKIRDLLDTISTCISSVLCTAMMCILLANVVLRLIPGLGGFRWYMESSQYLNVWAMLIACIGVGAKGTNLKVEVVDSIIGKTETGKKIVLVLRSVFIMIFYGFIAYSGYLLSTRAKQAVSTMPQFTMGQVYTIFPIAAALCLIATFVDMVYGLTVKEGGTEK